MTHIDKLKNAPIVEIGNWRKQNNKHECCICGFYYWTSSDPFNYCPKCGTYMLPKGGDTK